MPKCNSCGKKVSLFKAQSDFSGNYYCDDNCKAEFKQKRDAEKAELLDLEKRSATREIRYTCLSCENIWHKKVATESKAAKTVTGIFAGLSCCTAPCCFPLYGALFGTTLEDKACPKCQSENLKREIKGYDENGNPVN